MDGDNLSSTSACPNCGAEGVPLQRIDPGLKLRLQESGSPISFLEVCSNCYQGFNASLSKGARLRAEETAKEQGRLQLWRNRVNLVKQAKQLMASKLYSDAAIAYEKYLRILEIVYEKKPGELTPELFSNAARKHELTVIASVYWDLMRIYDVNTRYADRQKKAAEKLADFARFTPVFANIIKKAESQQRRANNPEAYKHFLRVSNTKRARCFIASSAFEGYTEEVMTLCHFRDEFLQTRVWGRVFVSIYYRVSPPIAELLDANPRLKPPVRKALVRVAKCVGKKTLNDRPRS